MIRKALLLALAAVGLAAAAQRPALSTVERAAMSDSLFIDMATIAAQTAASQGLKPCGAVVVLNGSFRSSGTPRPDGTSAEADAISKSRRKSLSTGAIYTVNHPTDEAISAAAAAGVATIYYVNPIERVTAAGIYPAEAFAEAASGNLPKGIKLVKLTYAPAADLVKN